MISTVVPLSEQDTEAWRATLLSVRLKKLLRRAAEVLKKKSPLEARNFLRSTLGQSHNDWVAKCLKYCFPHLHTAVSGERDAELLRFWLLEAVTHNTAVTPTAKEGTARWDFEQRIQALYSLGQLLVEVQTEMAVREFERSSGIKLQKMTRLAILALPLTEGDFSRLTSILAQGMMLDSFTMGLATLIHQYQCREGVWTLLAKPADSD